MIAENPSPASWLVGVGRGVCPAGVRPHLRGPKSAASFRRRDTSSSTRSPLLHRHFSSGTFGLRLPQADDGAGRVFDDT